MGCCQYHSQITDDNESAFTVDAPVVTFGPGCLREAGPRARVHGVTRAALFTDPALRSLPFVSAVERSLRDAGIDVVIYSECLVEPTADSFVRAAQFARDGKFDGFVSVGGGSVMDTCKVANLLATWPVDRDSIDEELLAYVNAPLGEALEVPGPLAAHIACPTTAGTGSEATGIAIFDYVTKNVKTGVASPFIRPTEALVDPDCTASLPRMVTACCAFDVLCHALESFTARPYTSRARVREPSRRPASQGANPWSDMGCREALRLLGHYMVRGVNDPSDADARAELMWAATLAGIAFGNCGVHAPHGMSYAVAGQIGDYHAADYPPGKSMVPHGMSVVVSAPAVFERTATGAPERHLEAAQLLGADVLGATGDDAGEVLASRLRELMKACGMPAGLRDFGYSEADVPSLVEGAYAQQRLLVNAPTEMTRELLGELFRASMGD